MYILYLQMCLPYLDFLYRICNTIINQYSNIAGPMNQITFIGAVVVKRYITPSGGDYRTILNVPILLHLYRFLHNTFPCIQ